MKQAIFMLIDKICTLLKIVLLLQLINENIPSVLQGIIKILDFISQMLYEILVLLHQITEYQDYFVTIFVVVIETNYKC